MFHSDLKVAISKDKKVIYNVDMSWATKSI